MLSSEFRPAWLLPHYSKIHPLPSWCATLTNVQQHYSVMLALSKPSSQQRASSLLKYSNLTNAYWVQPSARSPRLTYTRRFQRPLTFHMEIGPVSPGAMRSNGKLLKIWFPALASFNMLCKLKCQGEPWTSVCFNEGCSRSAFNNTQGLCFEIEGTLPSSPPCLFLGLAAFLFYRTVEAEKKLRRRKDKDMTQDSAYRLIYCTEQQLMYTVLK